MLRHRGARFGQNNIFIVLDICEKNASSIQITTTDLRRWPYIKPTLFHCLAFDVSVMRGYHDDTWGEQSVTSRDYHSFCHEDPQ